MRDVRCCQVKTKQVDFGAGRYASKPRMQNADPICDDIPEVVG